MQKEAVSKTKHNPVTSYRRRMRRQGIVRVEVQVREADVDLVRDVAKALLDPNEADDARSVLRRRFAGRRAKGLKALLAAAPLEGVDLTREDDMGRPVDL